MPPKLPKLTAQRGRPPKGWQETFIKALRATCNIRASCDYAGVSRFTAYKWKEKNVKFREQWEEAEQDAIDALEAQARKWAMGYMKPVFYKGEKVAEVEEHDTALMIKLLNAHRPEKYRDNYDIEKALAALTSVAPPQPPGPHPTGKPSKAGSGDEPD